MTDTPASKLQAADQSARQGDQGAPGAVQACPLEPREVVEVCIVGEDGGPLADIAVVLYQSDTSVLQDKSDNSGAVRFEQLPTGSYELRLPSLDKDAWALDATLAIESAASASGDAPWQAPASAAASGFTHTVEQGECTAKLAERYGFFADTLWQLPENEALRNQRKQMNILAPGDSLYIPAPRDKSIAVDSGKRYRIKRLGVPDVFRVRFLANGEPRVNEQYLASLEYLDDKVSPDCAGVTDADGFVTLVTSPSVQRVRILIGSGDQQRAHTFNIGHVDPLDQPSGVGKRLANLGYATGDNGPEALGKALRAFQASHGLPVTGEADAATLEKLQARYLS